MTQEDANEVETDVLDLEQRGWLPRHCRGDRQAFARLMQHYRSLVYTFLYRYGIDAQNRDDLFQEIFLKVHQAASSYQPNLALQPWLVSIVLNTVRNHRRNEARRWRFIKQISRDSEATAPGADVITDQRTTVQWLESKIGELPETQREVLTLTSIKSLRMKEIAKLLAIPESTVKTHLRRARLALGAALARRESQGSHLATGKVERIKL